MEKSFTLLMQCLKAKVHTVHMNRDFVMNTNDSNPEKQSTVLLPLANILLGIASACFGIRLVFFFWPGILIHIYRYIYDYDPAENLLIISTSLPGSWPTVLTLTALFLTFWTTISVSCGIRIYLLIARKAPTQQQIRYLIFTFLLALAYGFIHTLFSF